MKGLSEAAAQRIVAARAERAFDGVDDLAHRARLDARARHALADADALAQLAGHRHAARWATLGVEALPGMLAGHSVAEPAAALRAPREGEDIVADYASLGLTLRRHPLALLRARLDRHRVQRACDLPALRDGEAVRVAGLVINRQRPATASGVVFMTLEDETGQHNLIVWSKVLEAQRRAALGARVLAVSGTLQKAHGVIHVVARRFHDLSRWAAALPALSRNFH